MRLDHLLSRETPSESIFQTTYSDRARPGEPALRVMPPPPRGVRSPGFHPAYLESRIAREGRRPEGSRPEDTILHLCRREEEIRFQQVLEVIFARAFDRGPPPGGRYATPGRHGAVRTQVRERYSCELKDSVTGPAPRARGDVTGARRMPWHRAPTKDAASRDSPRGGAHARRSAGLRMGEPAGRRSGASRPNA